MSIHQICSNDYRNISLSSFVTSLHVFVVCWILNRCGAWVLEYMYFVTPRPSNSTPFMLISGRDLFTHGYTWVRTRIELVSQGLILYKAVYIVQLLYSLPVQVATNDILERHCSQIDSRRDDCLCYRTHLTVLFIERNTSCLVYSVE